MEYFGYAGNKPFLDLYLWFLINQMTKCSHLVTTTSKQWAFETQMLDMIILWLGYEFGKYESVCL